jgi:hypothetical protein
MDMTMSSIRPNRVEVVTSVQRRRRWTPEQKLEIVKQTNESGSSVSLVARQHGLTLLLSAIVFNIGGISRPNFRGSTPCFYCFKRNGR